MKVYSVLLVVIVLSGSLSAQTKKVRYKSRSGNPIAFKPVELTDNLGDCAPVRYPSSIMLEGYLRVYLIGLSSFRIGDYVLIEASVVPLAVVGEPDPFERAYDTVVQLTFVHSRTGEVIVDDFFPDNKLLLSIEQSLDLFFEKYYKGKVFSNNMHVVKLSGFNQSQWTYIGYLNRVKHKK